MRLDRHWMAVLGMSAACLSGCGGDNTPPANTEAANGAGQTSQVPPTAAINSPAPAVDPEDVIEPPKPGTPEALALQLTQLNLQPFPETDDVDKQRAARRERNVKIIELATDLIAATLEDPEKELLFNNGVHRLMDSTMQLALQGDSESAKSLYEVADALYKKRPKSKGAADAAWFVAKFKHENAQRDTSNDARLVKAFAQQARSFADKFPQEQNRSLGLLSDAAISADMWGLREDAIQCYATIRQKFPDSIQAEEAIAPLRRLNLPGSSLDLGGPTIEGGFVSVEQFKGSPILIVFWGTDAKSFVDQSKDIISVTNKYEDEGLKVIGVSVDTDELAIERFAEKSNMSWSNIYHADPTKRGWNSPVVTYYGIQNIPQMWLVGADGKVISTGLTVKDLGPALAKVVAKGN